MRRFDSSLEHLMAEARRIDLMLRREIARMRAHRSDAKWDDFRGLLISEEEMDSLLADPIIAGRSRAAAPCDEDASKYDRLLGEVAADIVVRKAESLRGGVILRLERLRSVFGLSPAEIDCMLIALLPELDLRYQRLYAYLQDDVTRKSPTVDTVMRLLALSLEEKSDIRSMFQPHRPLTRYALLSLGEAPSGKGTPLLEKPVRVEERVVDYLLGSDQVDRRLQTFVRAVNPAVRLSDVLLPAYIKENLGGAVDRAKSGEATVVFLQGPRGSGKSLTADALCGELQSPMLLIDCARLLASDISGDLLATLILREARLQGACPYWDHFDLVLMGDRDVEAFRRTLLQALAEEPGTALLGGEVPWDVTTLQGKALLKVELPIPSFATRREMWQTHLDSAFDVESGGDLDHLAGKFRLTGGQIKEAAAAAKDQAMWRGPSSKVGMADLYQACRAQSNQKLNALARRIQPKFSWQDIVLPKDQMGQLREITSFVQHRHVVFGEWGFERKVASGKGLNVLFAGPSGTGKTMAADIMAGELNLDLFKIDLSTVVSKYIGETEKNLDRIFREAQDSNAILFFDEADAIFGKRSEVRDSHDRYANIEIAYLLQKMEEYEGIVILATNLRKNIDEAFARRMQFSVEFPLPEEADRRQIWQKAFPQEAPMSREADLGFMARQFKITGGNIKNIALGAAFLAAADGRVVTMEHLTRATRREYQKIGRLCADADFAPYSGALKT